MRSGSAARVRVPRAEFDRLVEESYAGHRRSADAAHAFWNGELQAGPELP